MSRVLSHLSFLSHLSARGRVVAAAVAAGAAVAAVAAVPLTAANGRADPAARQGDSLVAGAVLRAADGTEVGTVVFTVDDGADHTAVRARVRAADVLGRGNSFHGFHIHANDDPSNGEGCLADPDEPSETWFTSADGHLAVAEQVHGHHRGDLPSVLLNRDGTADLGFTTARLSSGDLADRVVMVHAGRDNFGNVPLGRDAEDYRANSRAAREKTAGTGNAGDRVACGVIAALGEDGIDALR